VQYESSTHAEDATEQAGFEDDVVAWRCLARCSGLVGSCGALDRPVVAREYKGREIDLGA
jgi:hypothetical protein